MMKPTVHLNGSAGQNLIDENKAAAVAVKRAIEAVQAAAPNARDYYVQDDSAYQRARDEHVARLKALDTVLAELTEIYIDVRSQLDARKRA